MTFETILGHQHIKKLLRQSIENNRVAHAQLFTGETGTGMLPMAIAYATEILCHSAGENCYLKCNHLSHPDLHFIFPTATNNKVKKDPCSALFMDDFRNFMKEQPYGSLFDWYQFIDIGKKQGNIGVNEAKDINAKISLKSFEGGYKIVIIWAAEMMNNECANKLLKLLEEPPAQTVFILISNDPNKILNTITSRCQITQFPRLGNETIEQGLMEQGVSLADAKRFAQQAQGNFQKALQYANDTSQDQSFELWFVNWVRTAFRAKANKSSVLGLIQWSNELALQGPEVQKRFLEYCTEIFRQALMVHYGVESLAYMQFPHTQFKIEKFAPFIHNNNILNIVKELEKATLHIERNGNAKAILTDLSIKLTRFLHAKKDE